MSSASPRKAVFLDRDGVLNVAPPVGGYVLRPEDLKLELGVGRAVKRLKQAGYFLSVATNQRCAGVGLITVEQLDAIHARLQELIRAASGGLALDAIYYSSDDRGVGSNTRKPAPGMLLNSARDHGLDLAASWMIGDSHKDVGAALAAGVRPILIENPDTASERERLSPDVEEKLIRVRDIAEATNVILTGRASVAAFGG